MGSSPVQGNALRDGDSTAKILAQMTREQKAALLGIVPPSTRTLARYGLTRANWLAMLARQKWRCPICLRRVVSWNIDHEHIPGWKAMRPRDRKRHVRGVLCVYCNYRVVKSRLPADQAKRIADYLRDYERRRDA